ncbi:hypothetical protein ADIWIN_1492 [Winogradskyella psychrotolerans RS-3]|uniref:Uncharacterized protein n=2 Tax=Winogradskyella TaxID=286104 RepID=S7VVP1_9FLAO|nr:hypothetical protein ADIWIN_1492 [Winogradskyella psychrotolerans RS-3]
MAFLHKNLTKEDKQKIKDKIRKQERNLLKKTVIISTVVFIIIASVMYYIITKILSH